MTLGIQIVAQQLLSQIILQGYKEHILKKHCMDHHNNAEFFFHNVLHVYILM